MVMSMNAAIAGAAAGRDCRASQRVLSSPLRLTPGGITAESANRRPVRHGGGHVVLIKRLEVTGTIDDLAASAMVVSGFLRWAGALALAGFTLLATFIALRFWEMAPGMDRMMATNAFFEHLGLAGAFVIVAAIDLTKGTGK